MTMARRNWRAASASTDAIPGPSRRCRCQSSGRFSVRRSIDPILLPALLLPFERLAVERPPGQPGDPRRDLRRLARRHDLEQRLESSVRIDLGRRFWFARGDDEDEFALDALRFGEQPCGRLPELHPRHLFELFRELARDRDLALRAEALGE